MMNFLPSNVVIIKISSIAICLTAVFGQSSNMIRSEFHLIISSETSETGKWDDVFMKENKPAKLPHSWSYDMKQRIEENDGNTSLHLFGSVVGTPPIPTDYELFPGIGYYKLHMIASDFNEASSICSKEGGHLAIINSEAESDVLQSILKRQSQLVWAFVGVHDRNQEGKFVTIFGEPLESTGYTRWFSNEEPNGGTRENCVTVHRNGGLNDGGCNSQLPFFCEYDLSWANP